MSEGIGFGLWERLLEELRQQREELSDFELNFCKAFAARIKAGIEPTQKQSIYLGILHDKCCCGDDWKTKKQMASEEYRLWENEQRKKSG